MAKTSRYEEQRGSSSDRGYGYKWQQARAAYLQKNPLCALHAEMGRVVPAIVVDHKIPHRGDMKLFWDKSNWQSLCGECHSSHKQRLEKSGRIAGCNVGGIPVDPKHHWNNVGGGGG